LYPDPYEDSYSYEYSHPYTNSYSNGSPNPDTDEYTGGDANVISNSCCLANTDGDTSGDEYARADSNAAADANRRTDTNGRTDEYPKCDADTSTIVYSYYRHQSVYPTGGDEECDKQRPKCSGSSTSTKG